MQVDGSGGGGAAAGALGQEELRGEQREQQDAARSRQQGDGMADGRGEAAPGQRKRRPRVLLAATGSVATIKLVQLAELLLEVSPAALPVGLPSWPAGWAQRA